MIVKAMRAEFILPSVNWIEGFEEGRLALRDVPAVMTSVSNTQDSQAWKRTVAAKARTSEM